MNKILMAAILGGLAVSAQAALPVLIVAPRVVQPPPALMPGPAKVKQATLLRARPQNQATVEGPVPAGAALKLQMRQTNRDGAWWFTEHQGLTGWINESALSQ
ncbi:SH3 domain-containing protein [Solimonas sp. K1W22B-7]|uniref:SH3 domain-containing protein n=1 Tax=Solimonas sp. K1W22B-7 TaxID=2303331 RepID=UPI000E3312BC|nr:SH3 domain-containing protein [Solimonas sp. K1W22B-7]AXQ27315.1 SH3 domain-containing protein [Solimonas sp. K1W22B-7]